MEPENQNTPEPESDESSSAGSSGSSSLEYLRGLAEIAHDTELSELEVECDGVRFSLRSASAVEPPPAPIISTTLPFAPGAHLDAAFSAGAAPAGAAPGGALPAGAAAPGAAPDDKPKENLIAVVSPMVGVFYRQPSPSDPSFVEVGDKVDAGQTVALVEAMKIFNEIATEAAGVVAEIKAQAGDLVETGQVLMTIRPL